jgi:hypothetical protein
MCIELLSFTPDISSSAMMWYRHHCDPRRGAAVAGGLPARSPCPLRNRNSGQTTRAARAPPSLVAAGSSPWHATGRRCGVDRQSHVHARTVIQSPESDLTMHSCDSRRGLGGVAAYAAPEPRSASGSAPICLRPRHQPRASATILFATPLLDPVRHTRADRATSGPRGPWGISRGSRACTSHRSTGRRHRKSCLRGNTCCRT